MPRALLVLLGVASLLACSRPEAPAARPDPVAATTAATIAPAPSPTPTAAPAGLPGDVYCGSDGDCVLSCLAGAVNADWFRAWNKKGECEDGCSSKGMGARCVDHECVARDKSDAGVAECTHTSPVPAQWACAKDVDCFMSCAKGAVSRAWWEAWGQVGRVQRRLRGGERRAVHQGRLHGVRRIGQGADELHASLTRSRSTPRPAKGHDRRMAGTGRRSSGIGGDDRRLVADGEYAFIVVADDGLHWFLEHPGSDFSAEVARDALKTVGLAEHARIFDELIGVRALGAAIDDARVVALQARWDALPPVDAELATWVRSNAEGLELASLIRGGG